MEFCFKCCITSMLIGFTLGAVVVSQNKKVSQLVKQGTDAVTDKFEEIKDKLEKACQEQEAKSSSGNGTGSGHGTLIQKKQKR